MSGSVNKVTLIGNLGADPQVRQFPNGGEVVGLRVATTERWRDKEGVQQERTEWHNVSIFNENLAKTAKQYLKKGSTVYLEGQLETRKYEKDGVEKSQTDVVLRAYRGEMQMLGGRGDGESSGGAPSRGDSQNSRGGQSTQSNQSRNDAFHDDDVPF